MDSPGSTSFSKDYENYCNASSGQLPAIIDKPLEEPTSATELEIGQNFAALNDFFHAGEFLATNAANPNPKPLISENL